MKGVRKADDLFVCFGAKPNNGLSPGSSTRPEVGKGTRERVEKRNTEKSWRRETQEGRRAVDTGQQNGPVGMR